jgi:integrase
MTNCPDWLINDQYIATELPDDNLLKQTLIILQKEHPKLLQGERQSLQEEEAATLKSVFLSAAKSPTQYSQYVKYLAYILQLGNRLEKWECYVPSVPILCPRDIALFTRDKFKKLGAFPAIEAAFIHSLKYTHTLSSEEQGGQLICSAILYGGLIQKDWILCWVTQQASQLNYAGDCVWIDLELDTPSPSLPQRKRWFIDPLTEILIIYWQKNTSPNIFDQSNLTWHILNKWILSFAKKHHIPITQATELIHVSTMHLGLELPPFLYQYASGKTPSESLKAQSWQRLWQSQSVILPHKTTPKKTTQFIQKFSTTLEDKVSTPPPVELQQLYAALYNKNQQPTAAQSIKSIQALLTNTQIPDTLRLLAQWCDYRLKHRLNTRNKFNPVSMYGFLTSVAKPMISLMGENNPLQLDSWEMTAWYLQIQENAVSAPHAQHLKRVLNDFHQFLVVQYPTQVEAITNTDILNSKRDYYVDANLLHPEEFKQLTQHLLQQKNALHPDMPTVQKLVSILGFYCGLRRNEALKLKLIDLQDPPQAELWIQHHKERKLKTANAVRRLPLEALLPTDDLHSLLDWKKKRLAEEKANSTSPFLFCIPAMGHVFIPVKLVFIPIRHSMQQVTGDKNVRFHHLRHSFASWLLYRLWSADYPRSIPDCLLLGYGKTFFTHNKTLREQLFGHTQNTRKLLYLVSLLTGHSSPETTLRHYIHCNDLMLRHHLNDLLPTIDTVILCHLSKLKKTQIYAYKKRGNHDLSHIVKSIRHSAGIKVPQPQLATINQTIPQHSQLYDKVFDLNDLLTQNLHLKISEDELSKRWGHSPDQIKTWINAWKQLTTKHPSWPRQKAELQHLKQTLEALDKLTKKNTLVQWALSYFTQHHQASDPNNLPMDNPQDAKKYIRFLKALGVNKKDLIIMHHPPEHSTKNTQQRQQRYWAKQLNLSEKQIITRTKFVSTANKRGTIGIKVLNTIDSTKSNYGFRYALMITSTHWDISQPNP